MKKQLVAPSKKQVGLVTVVTTANGVLLAACGCGAPFAEDYKFARVPARKSAGKKASSKSFMAPQASCDCGGNVIGMNKVNRVRESHHTKRRLPKNNRTTVRGMTTTL